jgi:hexosaminidase
MSTIARRFAMAAAALTMLGTAGAAQAAPAKPHVIPFANLVPAPASATQSSATFTLGADARIGASGDASQVGNSLASALRPATGYALPVDQGLFRALTDQVQLQLANLPSLGDEGYQLSITSTSVLLRANKPAGLFEGVQTLRQLLPPSIDATTRQSGPWQLRGGQINDQPRFAYRGAMLDVARHFFGVSTVEKYIDELARYKINTLHLHLADDQGWRLQINSWPKLATYGGGTEVGGGPGGYYTQDQYKQIVAYAASRYITIIPEIDMPGHVNAALASYTELNRDGVAPPLYTGTDVGFSSLCVNKDITYTFLNDVIGEIAAITPGEYIHIGGDEARSTSDTDYKTFEAKVQRIVRAHGKTALGWHDISKATPLPTTVGQYWDTTPINADVRAAAKKGTHFVLSPANLAYLDMKYTSATKLGQNWAGYIEAKDAYDWDPGNYLTGVPSSQINGVEGPLWSETIVTLRDIQYMAFPRIAELAELAWSPESTHNWNTFKARLGAQGPRWTVQGINFYASPQVPWAKS